MIPFVNESKLLTLLNNIENMFIIAASRILLILTQLVHVIRSIFVYVMNLLSKSRISYTAHEMLENIGPTIFVDCPLTSHNIMDIISSRKDLNPLVLKERIAIRNSLQNAEFLDQVSGIFIHSAEIGLVAINGPNTKSKSVMSIRI